VDDNIRARSQERRGSSPGVGVGRKSGHSAAQVGAFLRSACRLGRERGPGEQGLARHHKRSGFLHAAAKSSDNLLKCDDNQLIQPPARQESRRPEQHKYAKVGDVYTAAGMESARIAAIVSSNIGTKNSKAVHQAATDPLTHTVQDTGDEDHHRDMQRKCEGAAGVLTDRLTYLNSCVLTTQPTIAKSVLNKNDRTDPISHGFSQPDTGRPTPRVAGSDSILAHSSQRLPTPSKEFARELVRGKLVRAPGEFIYNHAGEGDLLPGGTKSHQKADCPSSERHKLENDRRYLARFERPPREGIADTKQGNPCLLESEDMYYSMCGEVEGRRRHEIDRTGRQHEEEESGYGYNWVNVEISRGGDGQRRANSTERGRSPSPNRTGGVFSARSPQPQGALLRWPSHQQGATPGCGPASARSPNTTNFRGANGLVDWGGLNGLGMWSAPPTRARTPDRNSVERSSARTQTPDRAYVERLKSPQNSVAVGSGRPDRGSGFDNRSTPSRSRGGEFPKTPPAKSGTTRSKGGWPDTKSQEVQIFSL